MSEMYSKILEDLKIEVVKWSFYKDYTIYVHTISDNPLTNVSINEEDFQRIVNLSEIEDLTILLLDDNLLVRKLAEYKLKELEE